MQRAFEEINRPLREFRRRYSLVVQQREPPKPRQRRLIHELVLEIQATLWRHTGKKPAQAMVWCELVHNYQHYNHRNMIKSTSNKNVVWITRKKKERDFRMLTCFSFLSRPRQK